VRGIRLYLLKDDVSTLPQAIARYKRYVAWFRLGKQSSRRKNAVCKHFPSTLNLLLVTSHDLLQRMPSSCS
jgi:hypothetical protein